MVRKSRISFVCISLLVAGVATSACAEDKAKDKPAAKPAPTETSETRMKGASCPERLKGKRDLYADLECKDNKEDTDCIDLAKAIEELACQCGTPKPAKTVCEKYKK
ncbi:MAG: hypothetical protein K0U74_04025 [Alphaproteobacteria bacterium]|nr:hypothetical protein [Alphaproteobacteria bacterium]